MKLICGKPKLQTDYGTGEMVISFPIFAESKNDAMQYASECGDKLTVDVTKYRKGRSLDANAYAWVLIGKLAAKLGKAKEEVYRDAIKDIGNNYEVVCVVDKAVESFCKLWSSNGIGWQTDTFPSKIEGCTNVMAYSGSSTYNTEQMSKLINIIVEECKAQGIDTKTPNEIADMLSLWEVADEKHYSK